MLILVFFLVWLGSAQTPQEVQALATIISICDLSSVLAASNPAAPNCSDQSDLIFVCDPDGNHFTGLNLYRGCFDPLLGGIIPPEIGQLSWLEYLALDSSFLIGLPTEIGLLTNLTVFSLSENPSLSVIPTEIGLLRNLQELYLDNLDQLFSLPDQVGNLAQLTLFTASGTSLSPVPTFLGSLTRISTLRLSGCNITSFPTFIAELTSLQVLVLEDNPFSTIPSSIGDLSLLTTLSLGVSNFQTFPTEILALTQLNTLIIPSLSPNPIFSIPTQIGLLTSLTFLELHGNSLKSLPTQIGQLSQLMELDISKNFLRTLPSQFSQLTGLTRLVASFNMFPEIPTSIFSLTNMNELYWDTTFITSVPTLIGSLTNLFVLRLNNNLIASLPTEIGALPLLEDIQLISNLLTHIPTEIGLLSSLISFSVDANELTSLPTQLGNLQSISFIYAKGNTLHQVPTQLGQLPSLYQLDVSHNNISRLPLELSTIQEFSMLQVSNNRLEYIPVYPNLVVLDASYNFITSLDNISQISNLNSLTMVANKLTGAIPVFSTRIELSVLDLSLNLLTETETSFQNLAAGSTAASLNELVLAGNLFTGSIPVSIKNLMALTILDLSRNRLTTFLARDAQNFCVVPTAPRLLSLDLSYNQMIFPIQGELDYGSYQLLAGSTACALDERYTFTFKNVYTISIYPPLSRLDLSYNFLDDEFVTVGFQFVQNDNNNFPSLNVAGNRFNFEDSISGSKSFFCAVSPTGAGVVWLEARCSLLPQDFDDCRAGTHNCPTQFHSTCTDGWNPQMSYTCTCDPGYKPDLNATLPGQPCSDIDECQTSFPCGNGFKCINTEGSYYCERDLLALAITVPVAFGLIFLVIFFYFLFVLLYRLYQRQRLNHLPPEVSWTWRHAILHPGQWTQSGGYLSREFQPGTHEHKRAMDLINTLNFRDLEIKNISAVYNKTLVAGFTSTHKVQMQRFIESPKVFYAKLWGTERGDKYEAQRARVYQTFEDKKNQFTFNKDSVVILPVVHGTDLGLAERIAKTGFAALSAVDGGYYGKGIYFSSCGMYTFPYIKARRQPAIIISWILPGNPYPVVECYTGSDALLGTALKSGYQSHYVVTGQRGAVATETEWHRNQIFDEIVLQQESQIAPLYIIEIQSNNFNQLSKAWPAQQDDIRATNVDDGSSSLIVLDRSRQNSRRES